MLIVHTVEIAAPAERVWQVIVDLDRYPEWNPFVVACRSSLRVGEPIDMRVRVMPFFAQPQRETILEHEPGRRLCYGLPRRGSGALVSRRCHEVESLGPERTRYVSCFELEGWMEPGVRTLLGRRLAQGFAAMSAAIGVRAEALGTD
ncbi:MAG TPA: SRPBCC domain-containing protein [Myxococcota bacterium]|nr:SRPBCC domain-containing protein [Myxococcota bacterium]